MADGQTPQAEFKGLAYGQNQQANAGSAMVDNTPPLDPTASFSPQTPAESSLYGPTNRPAEPLTAGVPFGPGVDSPTVSPTPQQFIANVVSTVPQESVDPEVAAFARRVAEGL